MKKSILIFCTLSLSLFSDFSDSQAKVLAAKAEKIRQELKLDKPPLTEEEKKIIEIRKELNIPQTKTLRDTSSLNIDVKTVMTMREVTSKIDDSSITDTLGSAISTIKNSISLEDEGEESSFYKHFGLKEGEYLGLPSVFGINEKKKETNFGLSSFTDIKEMGETVYKGFKHSGQSAEFMSGVMYYNAKMYNTMFGVFDDSPFNIFEEEDEHSILDVFEKGNNILDIID